MQPFEQLNFDGFFKQYEKPKMGISTGLKSLDNLFFGFHPGCLYIVGGSSGMGKTAIFIDFILAAAKEAPVGMISMEMTTPELQERMVCRIADVNSQKLKAAKLDFDERVEVEKAIKTIKKLNPIAITETVNCFYPEWVLDKKTPDDSVEALVESWSKQGCKIIFLDYLQMSELAEKTDRDDIKVKVQVQKLKALSKKYNIPIVAAAQLSGAPEERMTKGGDPKPIMRDLWGSVFIRAAADAVMLIYREEYYHKSQRSSLYDRSTEDALICVPKLRSGPSQEEVSVKFKPYCCSFEDHESELDEGEMF